MDLATPTEVLKRHPTAVLSHEEATVAVGIDLVPKTWVPTITVPRNHGFVTEPGWRVSRRDVPTRTLEDGRRVTQSARIVLDLAATLSLEHAVASGDCALRKKLVLVSQLKELSGKLRGRGAPEARAVVALLEPKSGSVLESLLRVLLVTSGIPTPVCQALILDGRDEVARVDLCWRAHQLIVEADGYAFHSDRLAYRRDRERMNHLERLGWRVLRFTWEDVVGRPQHVVELVRHCLEAGIRTPASKPGP